MAAYFLSSIVKGCGEGSWEESWAPLCAGFDQIFGLWSQFWVFVKHSILRFPEACWNTCPILSEGTGQLIITCVALEVLLSLQLLSFIVHFPNFTCFFPVAFSTISHPNITQFVFPNLGVFRKDSLFGFWGRGLSERLGASWENTSHSTLSPLLAATSWASWHWIT